MTLSNLSALLVGKRATILRHVLSFLQGSSGVIEEVRFASTGSVLVEVMLNDGCWLCRLRDLRLDLDD